MYNNPYSSAYNPQVSIDRINSQIAELEKIKQQISQQPIHQPTNLTQNFQLVPANQSAIRYATSMGDVEKESVMNDTPYFSKDMSVVWIKNTKGEIKTYELTEIIPKDNKDLQIEYLQAQIEELKKGLKNELDTNSYEPVTNSIENEEPSSVPTISRTSKRSKWP